MMKNATISLDATALAAFAASLAALPQEEIRKAKKLYILNAIAEFKAMRSSSKGMLLALGMMSIIPIFLIIFIPSLISFRSMMNAQRQKILNAIDVWSDELGADATSLACQL